MPAARLSAREVGRVGDLDQCRIRARKFGKTNKIFLGACRGGHLAVVRMLTTEYPSEIHLWGKGLGKASRSGNRDVVDLVLHHIDAHCRTSVQARKFVDEKSRNEFIKEPTEETLQRLIGRGGVVAKMVKLDLNYGLVGACRAGDRKLVDLMVDRGACEWGAAYVGAARAGSCELMSLMQSYSATEVRTGTSIELLRDEAYAAACRGGHPEAARLAREQGAWSFSKGLEAASEKGHYELVLLSISHGATNYGAGFAAACGGGHRDVAELLVAKGATNFAGGLAAACQAKQHDTVEWLIARGAVALNGAGWGEALSGAVWSKDVGLIRRISKLYRDAFPSSWEAHHNVQYVKRERARRLLESIKHMSLSDLGEAMEQEDSAVLGE